MGKTLLGFAFIWAAVAIWTVLSRYRAGRAVQVMITAIVYGAWLSIIPLSIYFIGKDLTGAVAEDRYGAAVFIGVASIAFIPMFVLALIPWNHFCLYVWRKVGLKLPQSSMLGGGREYYDWERER